MRFAFTEDQVAFRDAVRDVLAKECTPATVRAAWAGGGSEDAWAALGAMGVLGVLAPEAAGGLGLTAVDLVLLLEESGFAALPEPLVEHGCVAIPLLDGPEPELLDGSVRVTAPFHHDTVVPYADHADWFLCFDAGAIRLVPRAAVELEPLESVDGARRLARVRAPDDAGAVVADGSAVKQAFERGAFGTAAQLVGLARRMIEMTVEYAKGRRQFGVPIGSFQAVKHHLADARIALEFARPLVYRAAWSLTRGDADASTHVSMAKSTASDAAVLAARRALQCHGAIGYSYEYDLHLFMKRTWALAAAWGDAAWHRDRVGRAIL
ncbi:MAG TPA: acyl-CoA dehydrogenase family protein [Acidimicrobiia bacterium]